MSSDNKNLDLLEFLKSKTSAQGDIAFLGPQELMALSPRFDGGAVEIQRHALSVSAGLNVEQTCLKGVRTAMEAAGVVDKKFFEGAEHAYQMIEKFQKNKSFVEIDCEVEDLDLLPAGAIVVWDHGSNGDAPSGHISVSNGDGIEMSDHACAQNTTGIRPNKNEMYGKKHVFLLKNGFTYNPWCIEYLSSHIDTTTNNAGIAHATLLLGAILQNENAGLRAMELAQAYDLDKSGRQDDEMAKGKQRYINFVQKLLKLPGGKGKKKDISDPAVSYELFAKIADLLNRDDISDEDLSFLNDVLSAEDIKKLNEMYKSRKPEYGIQTMLGVDNQLYIYHVSSLDGSMDMCFNSRGDSKLGWLSTIVQLIRDIQYDAGLAKDKKDQQLGNKLVSALSVFNPFIGQSLMKLYKTSLSMDNQTPQSVKQEFDKLLQNQIVLYQNLLRGRRALIPIKRKLISIIAAVKRMVNKLTPRNSAEPNIGEARQ